MAEPHVGYVLDAEPDERWIVLDGLWGPVVSRHATESDAEKAATERES